MGIKQVLVLLFLATTNVDANFPPAQGFFVLVNKPSRPLGFKDIYMYAIHTDTITAGDEVEFSKEDSKLASSIVQTDEIEVMGTVWGCYLRVGRPNSFKGSRFGTYHVTYTPQDGSPGRSINAFVRPDSKFLNTRGVYTVTVYPSAAGSTELAESDDNPIGVTWTPGCQTIRWCKGRQRNINTGHRLTLTSTKDAGIYTIQRGSRGSRRWFVQIEVIVASCPKDQYYDDGTDQCSPRSFSAICFSGGEPKDADDSCTCPQYFAGVNCGARVDDPSDLFALGDGDTSDLFCGDLPDGSNKCRGYLYCPGDLFGCKCSPGFYGNNCDRLCPKGKWGVDCSLSCAQENMICSPFDGRDEL